MRLTRLFGAPPERVVERSRVLVNVANEFSIFAVLVEFRNSDKLGTLKINDFLKLQFDVT